MSGNGDDSGVAANVPELVVVRTREDAAAVAAHEADALAGGRVFRVIAGGVSVGHGGEMSEFPESSEMGFN